MSGHHAAGARPVVALGIPEFVMESGSPTLCRADPEAYFAVGGGPGRARELCGGCSFLEACLSYAVERPSLWGVWGGTTRRERQALRRRGAEGRGPPAWLAELVTVGI